MHRESKQVVEAKAPLADRMAERLTLNVRHQPVLQEGDNAGVHAACNCSCCVGEELLVYRLVRDLVLVVVRRETLLLRLEVKDDVLDQCLK